MHGQTFGFVALKLTEEITDEAHYKDGWMGWLTK